MKKTVYLLLALIAASFAACNKSDDSVFLQGLWAMYQDGNADMKNGAKGNFSVWGYFKTHVYQQNVDGEYKNGIVWSLEDPSDISGTSYDYTYENGKLSYNGITVPVTVVDDNHIIIDGTSHWTRLVDWFSGYYDPAQIDLSKYNAHADSACWRMAEKSYNGIAYENIWANEYDIAASAKLRLETAKVKGNAVAYTWEKTKVTDKDHCGTTPSKE